MSCIFVQHTPAEKKTIQIDVYCTCTKMSGNTRLQWVGKIEYLLTSLGYMVGLGNLWRFPHRCFINGGGAFLIPYLLAVFLCTIPMLFLEMLLGQFASEGAITIWNFCPIFKGIGWAILFNLVIINIYYSVMVMYAFYYMVVSFVHIGGPLPWQQCPDDATPMWKTDKCSTNPFPNDVQTSDVQKISMLWKFMDKTCVNSSLGSVSEMSYGTFKSTFRHCVAYRTPENEYWNRFVLGVHESDGVDDLGPVLGRNAVCLLIVWLFILYACWRGIRSIAKVAYVTATLPVLLLVVLFVRGITLEGHGEGISFYVTPDWSKLGDMAIWSSAATQSMFSVGVAFGSHIVLASYNKFSNNCFRDGIILGLVDTGISIFGGFIVFSFLGHASVKLDTDISATDDNGPGLLFISYVQGISQLSGSSVWSFLFFMMVFTLGLDTMIVMVWTLYASLSDLFPEKLERYHKIFLVTICLFHYLLCLPLVTKGGMHVLVLLDNYAANFSWTIFLFVESVAICWIYGMKNFVRDIEMMIGENRMFVKWYLTITCMVTSPAFCVFIFIASAISYSKSAYNKVSVTAGGEAIGWLIIVTPIIITIAFACYQVLKRGRPTRGRQLLELIKEATVPYATWGPRMEENRNGRYATHEYMHTVPGAELRPDDDNRELEVNGFTDIINVVPELKINTLENDDV